MQTLFRVIKQGDSFYAQKRFSFLFWEFWESCWQMGITIESPVPYDSFQEALTAIEEYKKAVKQKNCTEVIFLTN